MNFGIVKYASSHSKWVVACEPHVRARIRRVFPRMRQSASETVDISDTPENSRELAWFLQRYPMAIADQESEYLQRRSQEHVDQEKKLSALFANQLPPLEVDLPVPPRSYQPRAAELIAIKGGLLLADDVGLGKTYSSVIPMARPEYIPALVVCFPHLTRQWEKELQRFLPMRTVHRVRSGKVYDLVRKPHQRTLFTTAPDILVISYHMLRTWAETLAGWINYIVFDECQQLRHSGSQIYDACKHVADKAPARMGLSATPIYNYGSEFHAVLDVLQPGCLGTREEFVREWCSPAPGGHSRLTEADNFGGWLRREGIMLRRTRREVGRELPKCSKIVHAIECDSKLLEQLEGDAIALARQILSSNTEKRFEASGQFDLIMRQATGISKAPYVAEFVKLLLENGEPKVVVFAWHREVYKIIKERLCRTLSESDIVMYTGSESPAEKEKAKVAFVDGGARVMLISLRSGAGLDGLQHVCRTGVVAELDWSPGVHEQCIGRYDRDGQQEPTTAYFLLAEEGTDPIISEIVGLKREQIEGVRNPDSALAEVVDTGENHLRRIARDLLERRGLAP